MKCIRIYLLTVAVAFIAGIFSMLTASEQIPAAPQKNPIALQGGTIHPVSGPEITSGIILFERGVITGIGQNVSLPPSTQIIDISGKHVYPGLIESGSQIGLVEIDAVNATVDYREIGLLNPNVQAQKAINPDSERFPITRSNGVALAVSKPVGGLISGQAALLMLDGWTWEDMTLKSPVGMVVNWPEMAIPAFADKETREKLKKQTAEQIEALKKAFRDARAYLTARESAGNALPVLHKTDLRWESLIPVLKNELPVWIHANTLEQIETALEWVQDEGIRAALVGGADAWRCAAALRERNIPVIVTPVQRLPIRPDAEYDEPFTLANKLHNAGVQFSIAGGSDNGNERNLAYHAAMASAFGLPRDVALKSITIFAAEILGVSGRTGSLETGKDATLIVTDGDPLEIRTSTEIMFIQGRNVDLGNRQKELYKKYQAKYRQIEN